METKAYSPDILPDCRAAEAKNSTRIVNVLGGMGWIPIFCANCGAPGGMVPEENCDFAFYLCDEKQRNCVAKWSDLANTYLVPDAVFFEKVREAQLEKYGRDLTPEELVLALKEETNPLAKLAKDRPKRR